MFSKSDWYAAAGYVSTKKDGSERTGDFTAFLRRCWNQGRSAFGVVGGGKAIGKVGRS